MQTPRPHWSTTIDPSRYHASARAFGRLTINPPVFFASSLVTLALIVTIMVRGDSAAAVLDAIRIAILRHCDNFLMLSGDIFLVVCISLMLSPYGRVRLGRDDERPAYSTLAWFSMLFGAGMGIGLVFYGVAEPVTHYAAAVAPPGSTASLAAPLGGAAGHPAAARDVAMAAAIFNWSLHPWAIYALLGLALALFSYRFDMPMSLRSACYPLFGQRVWGPLGDVIDVLAIFATLGGLTTSLGLGAQQAMAGISLLYGIPASLWMEFLLIAVMAFCTFLSVWGGIDRGIRLMSELNLWLAIALALFILLTGPTWLLLHNLFANSLLYAKMLLPLSNPVGRSDIGFYRDWSIYYWAWWISWAPFVGMFMARISRGRTVREFMLGALIAPTSLSILWMTVFGDTAIAQVMSGIGLGDRLIAAPLEAKLFLMLEGLPWASLTCFLSVVLILIFFITGWDSGTLVIDCMTAGGHEDTPLTQRVIWLLLVGGAAVILLFAGGLMALQTAAIVTGLPLAVLLLLICIGTVSALHHLRAHDLRSKILAAEPLGH